ncbi:putative GPI transamidase component Tta1 [Trypanosoma grayi]|uniref:putative GPI transamidase component Tta1 n=1 Tax=Trypanosoma grayi TaxID=71804 RepID=UPI0004F49A82|nr:putative GPI transamidase component Tta1 [Trypanosoma grayi]KEG09153.1 putative GPI transamidase component Tta1 [Trypanosoma grayi]
MAGWLGVDNFRDAVTLRRWAVARDVSGCHYALRALRQLQQSVSTHPDMPAPEDVSGTVQRLLSLIRAGKFSQLARAADDLQYHPLLLPQLYIPWDHALVVHTSILLPVFGMGIISVRLSIAARREQRRRTQQLADGARKAQ